MWCIKMHPTLLPSSMPTLGAWIMGEAPTNAWHGTQIGSTYEIGTGGFALGGPVAPGHDGWESVRHGQAGVGTSLAFAMWIRPA